MTDQVFTNHNAIKTILDRSLRVIQQGAPANQPMKSMDIKFPAVLFLSDEQMLQSPLWLALPMVPLSPHYAQELLRYGAQLSSPSSPWVKEIMTAYTSALSVAAPRWTTSSPQEKKAVQTITTNVITTLVDIAAQHPYRTPLAPRVWKAYRADLLFMLNNRDVEWCVVEPMMAWLSANGISFSRLVHRLQTSMAPPSPNRAHLILSLSCLTQHRDLSHGLAARSKQAPPRLPSRM